MVDESQVVEQEEQEEQVSGQEPEVDEGEPSSPDVKEEQPLVDDKGVPLKNRLKEFERKATAYQEKYEKLLEETRQQFAKKEETPVEPAVKRLSLKDYTEQEWEEAEDKYGASRQEIIANYNRPIDMAEKIAQAAVKPLEEKIKKYEYAEVKEKAIEEMAAEKPDIKDYSTEINKELDRLRINRDDPEEFKSAINMVYYAVKGRRAEELVKKAGEHTAKKAEEHKRMVTGQPEPSTPPVQKGKQPKITWSEKEDLVRQKMGISVEDWAKHR